MNTLLKTIQHRRSRFPAEYTGAPIGEEDLQQILEAARWAPNHRKTEPWRYKVLRGNALDQLGSFMISQYEKFHGKPGIKARKLAEKMQKSSAVILIFLHRDETESVPEWEESAAVAMSVQNMWLMTHELGYGGYWSSPKDFADMQQFEPLNIKSNDRFLGFFYLGTVEQSIEELPERKAVNDFVEFLD